MSPKTKQEYTAIIAKRYKKAKNVQSKKIILDEYCKTTGYHRKHAIRKLNSYKFFIKPKRKKPGKESKYNNPRILEPLKNIRLKANLPCSKLLKSIIPLWLPHYAQIYHPLELDVIKSLKKISAASIDRNLKSIRFKFKKRPFLHKTRFPPA